MNRDDKLTQTWKALEVAGASDDDVLDEALAGLESDDNAAYERLRRAFSNERGWRG